MGMVGDMKRYTQFQAADSISLAAENPGGVAGAGAGIGAGLAMGQMMAGAMSQATGGNGAAAVDPMAMLEKLDGLLKKGILTQAEFDAKKTELLQQIK
jgi:membrane protease subunit (stomatin/prohibitin family)